MAGSKPQGARAPTSRRDALNNRQFAFVQEYLRTGNATRSAITVGYKARTAHVQAAYLLRLPKVARLVQEARHNVQHKTQVTKARVVRELARIAFADPADVLDFSGQAVTLRPASMIPAYARRAIASIKVKRRVERDASDAPQEVEVIEFRWWPKTDALQQLGKHLGLFVDRHEITGANGGPITIQAIRDAVEAMRIAPEAIEVQAACADDSPPPE